MHRYTFRGGNKQAVALVYIPYDRVQGEAGAVQELMISLCCRCILGDLSVSEEEMESVGPLSHGNNLVVPAYGRLKDGRSNFPIIYYSPQTDSSSTHSNKDPLAACNACLLTILLCAGAQETLYDY